MISKIDLRLKYKMDTGMFPVHVDRTYDQYKQINSDYRDDLPTSLYIEYLENLLIKRSPLDLRIKYKNSTGGYTIKKF